MLVARVQHAVFKHLQRFAPFAAGITQNIGVAIVPAEKYELFDPCLVPKQIEDERLFVEKTLSVVKGRPLSTVAKTFVNFFLENF